MYKISKVISGPIGTNCYTLINDETKEAVLIDATGRADLLTKVVKEEKAKVVAILLTHAHFDHMDGVDGVKEVYPDAEVIIGKNDEKLLGNPSLNLSLDFMGVPVSVKADKLVEDGEEIELIGLKFKCIEVPGHTIGGMCYYAEIPVAEDGEETDTDADGVSGDGARAAKGTIMVKVLFDGDTLFHGSIGRSDFPTGDGEALITNIETKLLTLPEETQLFPGHDSGSTIGWEKRNNMYFV